MIIFCGSKASAEQTLEHIVPFIEKELYLKVNREKTVVAYAGKIKSLGYGFYKGRKGFSLRVHAKSEAKMEARVRELTGRRTVNDYEKWKVDLKRYVVGWVNYYKLADMGAYLQSIDEWMRRRIRMVVLEEVEKSSHKMEKPAETGNLQQKCGHPCQFQKGVLADSIQPYTANSPLKPKA